MVLLHIVLTFCTAAILAPFSYYAGQGARYLRLPQITGYLLSGIVCGPFLLGILSKESVTELNIIEGACLSIIGLAAGAELDLPALQRARKQVIGITTGICVGSWILCFAAFDWAVPAFGILGQVDTAHALAFATLGATLMMTRSPASAVILPTRTGAAVQLIQILLPVLSVILSMAVGAFGGVLLGVMLRSMRGVTAVSGGGGLPQITEQQEPRLPHTSREMYRMGLVLAASTFIFQLSEYFEAEPLLACVTMGMVLVNRRHERGDKDKEEVHLLVSSIMSVTNVAFFGLVGASLKLSALKDMLVPALFIVAVRLVAIYTGSWLGCHFTQTQADHRRFFWASMVTQAGVALGLARLAGARYPDWGPTFQTYMMAIILVNLLIGPPLFRWALVGVGEARAVLGAGSILNPLQDMNGAKMIAVDMPAGSAEQQTSPRDSHAASGHDRQQ